MAVHSDPVRPLPEVIREAIRESGRSQRAVAVAIGEKQQTVSKWVSAIKPSEPKLSDLAKLEHELGLAPGTIARRAGYVKDPKSTKEWIAADPDLDPDGVLHVLDVYKSAVRRSRERRKG